MKFTTFLFGLIVFVAVVTTEAQISDPTTTPAPNPSSFKEKEKSLLHKAEEEGLEILKDGVKAGEEYLEEKWGNKDSTPAKAPDAEPAPYGNVPVAPSQ